MSENLFPIPPAVIDQYEKLYDLVQNKSKDGRVDIEDLAEYLCRSKSYVSNVIKNKYVPYAYSDGSSARAVAQIGILPLYQFEMQNGVFVDMRNGYKR